MGEAPDRDFYSEIGNAVLSMGVDLRKKFLLYSEIEPGVITASLIYQKESEKLIYREPPRSVLKVLMEFWQKWKDNPNNEEWKAISYFVDNGKMKIDLIYPDRFDLSINLLDRRRVEIIKNFGHLPVDWSRPDDPID